MRPEIRKRWRHVPKIIGDLWLRWGAMLPAHLLCPAVLSGEALLRIAKEGLAWLARNAVAGCDGGCRSGRQSGGSDESETHAGRRTHQQHRPVRRCGREGADEVGMFAGHGTPHQMR